MIRPEWRGSHFHVEQILKYLDTIFDDRASRQPARPAARGRASVELDDDLFLPADHKAAVPPAAFDFDERPWPTLELPVAKKVPDTLEKKIAEQATELAVRCTQVADLYNLQERQAAELQVAYAEIDRLNGAFATLEGTAIQHAEAAAERKKSIAAINQENVILRSKLEKALDDVASTANQMLTVETMFNDREMVITTALEQADLLKAELAAAEEEKIRLAAAIRDAEQLHQADRDRNDAAIDELNRKLESLFADNGVHFKTREKLARRCDEMAKTNASLESAHRGAMAKLAAQDEHMKFVETVLRVERETSAARIKELTDQLEQERAQRAATDTVSNTVRQEMTILLSHIAQRQAAGSDEKQPTPIRPAHRNAA